MDSYKLVVRTIQCTADADPTIHWDSHYVGVIDATIESQKTSRIMWDAIAPQYRMMCSAIDGFSRDSVESGVKKITQIERGELGQASTGNDAMAAIFDSEKATFWCEFGFSEGYIDDGLGEEGGQVTFAQFKLVMNTYLQFLRDPERKPIEVPFSE